MKNEGKFRLKQIDFFGILSTHTTMIEEVDEEVQHRYDIIERDTPAYLDLWLRAQLHGYADDIDLNLVRDSVERTNPASKYRARSSTASHRPGHQMAMGKHTFSHILKN